MDSVVPLPDFESINLRCWRAGIEIFNSTLLKDDKKRIDLQPNDLDVIQGVQDLFGLLLANVDHERTRGGSIEVLSRLTKTINKYAKVVDVFIQQQPDITAVVWGTVRFLIQVVIEEDDTRQSIGNALADILTEIGRWESYLNICGDSQEVQGRISVLYAEILNFLIRAQSHYKKPKAVRYAKAILMQSKEKYVDIVKTIQKHSGLLEKEFMMVAEHRTLDKLDRLRHELSMARESMSATYSKTTGLDQVPTKNRYRPKLTRSAAIQLMMCSQEATTRVEVQASQLRKDVMRIREWLQIRSNQSANIAQPEEGTCQWIQTHDEYLDWVQNDRHGFLWIRGNLGCGKSVLAEYLRDCLATSGSFTILYNFQASVDLESARPRPFVTSILSKLLQNESVITHPRFNEIIKTLKSFHDQNEHDCTRIPLDSTWPIALDLIQLAPPLTLIVDGLDECEVTKEFTNLVAKLENLGTASNARVLVLSRQDPFNARPRLIHMNADKVKPDIERYVNAEISRSRHLPPIRPRILHRVNMCCNGMFLWAVLLMEYLREADTPRMQTERLEAFPQGLTAAYEAILMISTTRLAHDKDKLRRRQELFQILVGSLRPLTVDEVCVALAVQPSCTELDKDDLPFDPEENLLLLSRPFATIHEQRLQLTHLSVKEFLTKKPHDTKATDEFSVYTSTKDSNEYLTRKCFARLSEAQYQSTDRIGALLRKSVNPDAARASDNDQVTSLRKTVFYEYAASYWPSHLMALHEPPSDILALAHTFWHGNEFVSWAEYIYSRHDQFDDSPIAEVRSQLISWHSILPPQLRGQVKVRDFFIFPYRTLSAWYSNAGDDNTLQWLCLYRLGDFYIMIADSESANAVREEVVAGLTALLGKNHPLTLKAISKMALHFIVTGDMKRAAEVYLETSEKQLEVVGSDKPDAFESLHYAADAQYYLTQYSTSCANQGRAAGNLFRLVGNDSPSFLMCQLFYAYAITGQGQLDQALVILKGIYTNRTKILGPENAMGLMAQVALSEVHRKLGRFDDAKENLEQACEIRIRIWGIGPVSTVDTVIHLIILYRESNKPDEAWDRLRYLLQPSILDLYFERLCQVSHLCALLHIDAGNNETAIDMLREIISTSIQKGRESNNRSLLWIRLTLSTLLRDIGNNDEASELFEDILTNLASRDIDTETDNPLDSEPQPPEILEIAEKALRLVRERREREAEELLKDHELWWKRDRDFWIMTGGPAADTGWMRGP